MDFIVRMIEEKGLMNETLQLQVEGVNHFMPVEVIIEFLGNSPIETQNAVKNQMSKIDFMNGDIMHFLKYMAKGIIG